MRTLIVAGIGLVLAFGFVYAGKAMGKGTVAGAIAFLAVWLIFCAIDFSARGTRRSTSWASTWCSLR